MQQLPLDRKLEMVLPFLVKAKLIVEPVDDGVREKVRQIVQAAGDRIKIAGDILDYADFFTADELLPIDDKAFDKRIRKPEKARILLAACRDSLATASRFDVAAVEQQVAAFVQAQGIELGDIIHALRVAVTGKGVGFGLYETLAILGKQPCLARIERALGRS